jgi:glutaminyl-peptide cyclotransferase
MMTRLLVVALLAGSTTFALLAHGRAQAALPVVVPTVVATYPHDPRAYTQGLVIAGGELYEGTGWYAESSLRRVDLATGTVLQQVMLPAEGFGEGIAVVGDRIVQLTWKSRVGYVYDRATFELLRTFSYPTEGWGLTYDGTRLIMSDGSSTLRFLDPESFAETSRLVVRANERRVDQLNELELVGGELLANVYQSDQVAVIDLATGDVRYWLDLSGLNPSQHGNRDEVLNGIAYDVETGRLFVTGKRWPTLYELSFERPAQ